MEGGLLLLAGLGTLLAIVAYAFHDSTSTERERPVLPSHYSSLLYTDEAHYPGHCTTCGTNNEPGYRFCEACGSQIPTSSDYSRDVDIERIFSD